MFACSTIPIDSADCSNQDCNTDLKYGMHEDYNNYRACALRNRNQNLFTADQVSANAFSQRLTFPPLHFVVCTSVVVWFLSISSFTRSRHLSFGLPRFRFRSTSICNIFQCQQHSVKSLLLICISRFLSVSLLSILKRT